jgi:hypothetical protein
MAFNIFSLLSSVKFTSLQSPLSRAMHGSQARFHSQTDKLTICAVTDINGRQTSSGAITTDNKKVTTLLTKY